MVYILHPMHVNYKFYDRKEELALLNKLSSSRGFKFIVIYGRRRIGKTRLVQEFLRNKEHTYVFVPKDKTVDLFLYELSNSENIPRFTSISDLLKYLLETNEFIFFDEFQNFYYLDKSVYSDFQKLIDEYKYKQKNISLLVSGSSFSLMKKILGEHSHPLYGRADIVMRLLPLDIDIVMQMLFDAGIEDISERIKFYSVFGGVPKYYELINRMEFSDFESAIKMFFFDIRIPLLKEEGKTILISEFGGEYKTYFSILETIASGKNRLSQIANIFGGKSTTASRYLSLLRNEYEIIRRQTPITDDPKKSRAGIYQIDDNFLKFWFAFVKRYESYYEQRRIEELWNFFLNNYNIFIGKAFEEISREFLIKKNTAGDLPFKFDTIGNWWGTSTDAHNKRIEEIDLIGLNEKLDKILFIECKWQDLEFNKAQKVLYELKKKSNSVSWSKNKRNEYFGIIAKKIEGKEKLKRNGCIVFDLDDFNGIC